MNLSILDLWCMGRRPGTSQK